MKTIQLLPLPQVHVLTDDCKAKTYNLIGDGLFPPPVKVGKKSVWPRHEIEAILIARIGGASDEEMRVLVKKLVAQRRSQFEELSGEAA
jgi:prophage regulatory protein